MRQIFLLAALALGCLLAPAPAAVAQSPLEVASCSDARGICMNAGGRRSRSGCDAACVQHCQTQHAQCLRSGSYRTKAYRWSSLRRV
jgi:hypothetical protein